MAHQPGTCALTAAGCARRVERLRVALAQNGCGAAVIEDHRDVYYFTGAWLKTWPCLLVVPVDGEPLVVCNEGMPEPLVGRATHYQAQDMCSSLRDARTRMARVVRNAVGELSGKVGMSLEHASHAVAATMDALGLEVVSIDSALWAMQQFKDEDEIVLLRAAIAANEAGYAAVRDALRPGMNEIEVFEIAHAAICCAAGCVVEFGGDFQAGQAGGPARDREIEAGELYIVDSFPTVRGYWSDMARTFAVGEPTAEQAAAHDRVAETLARVEETAKPGQRTADVFKEIAESLAGLPFEVNAMPHHAGHGIGLRAHEWPRLWPHAEDTFEAGQVFTCEPGVYGDALRAGVRLEETFLVTDSGVEKLTSFPLSLG